MMSSSIITLEEEALKQNWEFLRTYFGKDQKISAVVKGNAYGHGIEEFIPLSEACGVHHFSVYNAGEAYKVFSVAKPTTTIMIMGAMDANDIEWAVENNIHFFVFDLYRLNAAVEASKKFGKKAIIHIEVETGMYRSGFDTNEVSKVIEQLNKNADNLKFEGLCMHFAGAEHISNQVRLQQQKTLFKKIHKKFIAANTLPTIIHTCCSAAAIRFPEMRYDLIRIGIMQYGFWPSPEIKVEYMNKHKRIIESGKSLKRVISWESNVMSIKNVPAGAFIGYGYSFMAPQKMKIAIVPVGYAHGFSRSLSNSGYVLIHGIRSIVIGIVNMNCIAVDVTLIDDIKTGDEVILIGKQGEQECTVASFSEMTNLLNYELLTRLPTHIPRQVHKI